MTAGTSVPLPFDRLEHVYEQLAGAIDRAGPEAEALFLAKLVMVLAHRAGEGVDFADCVEVALRDLAGRRDDRGQS